MGVGTGGLALTDERHQALLDHTLHEIHRYLNRPTVKEQLSKFITQKLPDMLKVGGLQGALGLLAAEKIVETLGELVAEIDADAQHPLRGRFHRAVEDFIYQLQNDSNLRHKIERYQQEFTENHELTIYIDSIWQDAHAWLHADLSNDVSAVRTKAAELLNELGRELLKNTELRETINSYVLESVPLTLETVRPKIGTFISSKMREWKDQEIVEKLELNIGPDLQYIRLNGTFVGGLMGLLIHAVTVLMH